MAHSMTTGMLDATLAPQVAPFLLCQITTNAGIVRFWNGLADLSWNGETWKGVGEFLGIDQVEETADLQASSVAISLSGIPTDLISIALQSLSRYMPALIYLGAFDLATGAIIVDPFLIRNGRVDTGTISDQGDTASITVTAESRLISMMNSRERRYTDQDQQIEHPGDFGFSFVDQIQNVSITWGQIVI